MFLFFSFWEKKKNEPFVHLLGLLVVTCKFNHLVNNANMIVHGLMVEVIVPACRNGPMHALRVGWLCSGV
jgi:hypothetical protein